MNLFQVITVLFVLWISLDVALSSQQTDTVYSSDYPDENIEKYSWTFPENPEQLPVTHSDSVASSTQATTFAIATNATINFPTDQKIFDLFINHTEMIHLLPITTGNTGGYINPHGPGRFKQPNGLYHLHCRNVYQWIDNNKEQYRNATNLIATIIAWINGTNDTWDRVCYFVDTIDDAQANCLRQYVEIQNAFPWAEYAARVVPVNYETPTLTSANSNDTYCRLLYRTPFWGTWMIIEVVLLGLAISVIFAVLIAKSYQKVIARARTDSDGNVLSPPSIPLSSSG